MHGRQENWTPQGRYIAILVAVVGFPGAAAAQLLDGTGSISGAVTASTSLTAPQVHALNLEKQIRYVVYAVEGRYRAMNLFPGTYDVSVRQQGYGASVQQVVVDAGQDTGVDFTLLETGALETNRSDDDVELVDYDTLYPPGPGRAALEKNCTYCHTQEAPVYDLRLSNYQWTRSEWEVGVDPLINIGGPRGTFHNSAVPGAPDLIASSTISLHPLGELEITVKNTLSDSDREIILDYLVENFGPDSNRRAQREQPESEIPLDESALSKAMYVEYYVLPNPEIDSIGDRRQVQDPHFDQNGNVWFTDRGTHNRVSMLDPRTGAITDYLMPDTRDLDPHGLTVDADGHVWWLREFGLTLGRLNPNTGEMTQYSANVDNRILGGAIHTPALDSAQNLWFTVMSGNHLGKWERDTDKITLYRAPTQEEPGYGYGIIVDSLDKVWFAPVQRCELTRFDPETERFSSYHALGDPSAGGCIMRRLDEARDGAIWYGVHSHGKLGKLDPSTGEQELFDMPVPFGKPYALQIDPTGNVWVGDGATGIVRFNPRSEEFTYFPYPRRTAFPKIEITRDGAVWFGTRDRGQTRVSVLYPDMTQISMFGAYY